MLSMGNACPSMVCQFLAMLLATSGLPSSGLLALAHVPKGVVEGLLGGLPVSKVMVAMNGINVCPTD